MRSSCCLYSNNRGCSRKSLFTPLRSNPLHQSTSIPPRHAISRHRHIHRRTSTVPTIVAASFTSVLFASSTATAATAITTATSASSGVGFLAVIVGWLVIAGSLIRSVPQIIRILKNKSAEGLSLVSILSDLTVYIVTVSYNTRFRYPFSTWGDTLFILIQQLAIIALYFKFDGTAPKGARLFSLIFILAITGFLFSDACSIVILTTLQACSAALLAIGGRLPQIALNWRRGNSGELSLLSTGLSVAGNVARVFTTVTLVGDYILLLNVAMQLLLNSILLYQCIDTAQKQQQTQTRLAVS